MLRANKLGRKEQLCWSCSNAGGKCSWSKEFFPVEGWDAFFDKKVDTYEIYDCPEFKHDTKTSINEDLINENGIGIDMLKQAIVEQALEDYISILTNTTEANHTSGQYNSTEILRFLRSPYFQLMCELKPDYLIKECRNLAKRMERVVWTPLKMCNVYHLIEVRDPDNVYPEVFETRSDALVKAADLQHLEYRRYMKIRRRDGFK